MDPRKELQQHGREEEHKEAQTAAEEVHSRGTVHAHSDIGDGNGDYEHDYDSDELEEHHAAYIAAGQALAALRDPHRLPPQLRQSQQQQQQQLQQSQQQPSQQLKQPQQPLSSLPWCQAYLERDEPPTKKKQRVQQQCRDDDDDADGDTAQHEDEDGEQQDDEEHDEDEDEDEESAALEELADLKREYGKLGSSLAPSVAAQRSGPLPALTAALALDDARGVPLKPDAPVELLRVPGATAAATAAQGAEAHEDWDLLGLECDCPCLNCIATAVAPTFELFEQDARRRARQNNDTANSAAATAAASASSSLCACECIQLPPSGHAVPLGGSWSPAVIVDALEDFFRLRTHMHRVTFARAMAEAEKSIRAELDEEDKVAQLAGNAVSSLQRERRLLSLRRKAFSRSLVFLSARCRRDLRHLELLEACANQLGWNVEGAPEQRVVISASDIPSKRQQQQQQQDLFVECASPGPRPPILPTILIELLSYFIPQQRGAHPTSHYDKCALTTLCSHLLHYLVAVGSADPSNRVVQECVTVCERMETDLPLADLVETELYKHCAARIDAAEEAAAAAKDSNAAVDAAVFPSDAPPPVATASSNSTSSSAAAAAAATVLEAFAGHWVIEGVVEPTGFSACRSSRAPPLLVLRPAVPTRSKMSAYRELERQEQQSDVAAAARTAAKAASASSTPSLSLRSSSLVRVVVPHSVLELLSEASAEGGGGRGGGGRDWSVDLEIARYGRRQASPGETATVDEQYFHITKAGHVNCS